MLYFVLCLKVVDVDSEQKHKLLDEFVNQF